ncbi:response regulator transcription factor [Variovorax sp. HJSM1_2]|uniref:response regulator transcription factor n=1 Tax=Variovorax sp. HJSM1_2 TaxID=3366263 RepID=UPI003BCB5FA2
MANVILLEDEPILLEELTEFLVDQGHSVTATSSLEAFTAAFRPSIHQVAVLDRGLPDGDGMDLVLRMRRDGLELGVIVLTARGGTLDKVHGLHSGADYYIPKTSDLAELAATIEALARRMHFDEPPRWILQSAPRQLTPPGAYPIQLSAQDFTVLKTLAQGGEVVHREAIVKALGANWLDYDQRRLDTQMTRLRRKVQEACGQELPVSTIRSVGFSFRAPVDVRL